MGDQGSGPMAGYERRRRLHVIVGTRPEAVKVAPLALALSDDPQLEAVLVDTGQQPGRVAEALAPFGIKPDVCLGMTRSTGSLPELAALTTSAVEAHLATSSVDAVLVQGDTSTAFVAGLTASWLRLPLVHLEAGLRTRNRFAPFPEESNRAMLARIADLHLAPTPRARQALALEGVVGDRVVTTGNTVVDALEFLLAGRKRPPVAPGLVTVTVHRREAWGAGIDAVCAGVLWAKAQVPQSRFVIVVHPNPAVASQVREALGGLPGVDIQPPLPYDRLLDLLQRSELVLTDSGGIQEEAPSLGLPVLIARELTERPEAVQAGSALLVGLDARKIGLQLVRLLRDAEVRQQMAAVENPYGDGMAAARSAAAVKWLLGLGPRPSDWPGQISHRTPVTI